MSHIRQQYSVALDVELLEACKQEFHRRLKVYHHWKNKNKASKSSPQDAGDAQRAPQEVVEEGQRIISTKNFSFRCTNFHLLQTMPLFSSELQCCYRLFLVVTLDTQEMILTGPLGRTV